MQLPNALTHRKARSAQIGLSYFFLFGFFFVMVATGLGYMKVDVIHFMEGGATMILSFWFMRQRETGSEPVPTQPVTPASQEPTK